MWLGSAHYPHRMRYCPWEEIRLERGGGRARWSRSVAPCEGHATDDEALEGGVPSKAADSPRRR